MCLWCSSVWLFQVHNLLSLRANGLKQQVNFCSAEKWWKTEDRETSSNWFSTSMMVSRCLMCNDALRNVIQKPSAYSAGWICHIIALSWQSGVSLRTFSGLCFFSFHCHFSAEQKLTCCFNPSAQKVVHSEKSHCGATSRSVGPNKSPLTFVVLFYSINSRWSDIFTWFFLFSGKMCYSGPGYV